jgi:uncharacterized protein YebE (UPF0316 family)
MVRHYILLDLMILIILLKGTNYEAPYSAIFQISCYFVSLTAIHSALNTTLKLL